MTIFFFQYCKLLDGGLPSSSEDKLPVALMISAYCSGEPDCRVDENVQKIVKLLAAPISSECSVDDQNINKVTFSYDFCEDI